MMPFESWHVRTTRFSDQSRKWNDSPPPPMVPLSSFQGQTDQQKTMWEGSRETLETVDRRAGNNKRIHGVNVGKIHG